MRKDMYFYDYKKLQVRNMRKVCLKKKEKTKESKQTIKEG